MSDFDFIDFMTRIAYHEAGHAVIAYKLNLGVGNATILEGEQYAGQVEISSDIPDAESDESWYRNYSTVTT